MTNSNNELVIKSWLKSEWDKIEKQYEGKDELRPKEYESNEEALTAMESLRSVAAAKALVNGNRKPGIGEAAEVIIENTSVMIIPTSSGHTLACWDYDTKNYTFDSMKMLNDYVIILLGSSSQSILNNLTLTLIGMRRKAVIYNPLPPYLVPVGNGVYNCLTKELEEPSPYYAILTKISTNYYPDAKQPKYKDGFTLESMIKSLSNHSQDREDLLKQIVKSILIGYSIKPGLFVILGKGGDGKSTFFTMIANMVGQENVAYVNFSQIEEPDKMAETVNKKFVLGIDNDTKLYIKKTAIIKTIASHEVITLSRKYLSAVSVPFTATMVQLCNEFPRIAETGSSIKRRIVPFKAENSYYEKGTENDNVDNIYIKDKKFLEYALKYFLDESTTPYFSDYNDVDRSITLDALGAEDTMGQFVSELEANGILDPSNKILPLSHLYAAYLDWASNSNVNMMSAKNFSLQIATRLDDFGYTLSVKQVRSNVLEKSKEYDTSIWGDLVQLPKLSDAISFNRTTRYFELTGKPRPMTEIRRNSQKISSLDYFKLTDEIRKFSNNLEIKDEEIKEEIKELKEDEEKLEKIKPIVNHVSSEIKEKLIIPVKITHLDGDSVKINQVKKWLLSIDELHQNELIDNIQFGTVLDQVTSDMKILSRELKDTLLMSVVTDIQSASLDNTIWLMLDFLDRYEENMLEGKYK